MMEILLLQRYVYWQMQEEWLQSAQKRIQTYSH